MSNLSLYAKKLHILQQKLHREELKLARLKTKANAERRSDARRKLRLGGLIFLMKWETISEEDLENLCSTISSTLKEKNDLDGYRIHGENTLKLIEKEKQNAPKKENLSEDDWRELNHRKISIGGLMVKYELHTYSRSVVLGALLDWCSSKS
ncbi:hypothetical protein [Maritalea sp.]|uniref:hypothetical protein n=1 Tax=Maritalea sp. TaxID=2003361 RepID=UPI003EFA92E7